MSWSDHVAFSNGRSVLKCSVTVGEAQCHWPPFHPCCWGLCRKEPGVSAKLLFSVPVVKFLRGQWVREISLPCMYPACVHVPEVQLCIKIKFQNQLIPMEKYIWDYIVMCAKAGWEHCGYWMHCECCGINAACLCRMYWNPSDSNEAVWKGGSWLMQAVCLSVLSRVCRGAWGRAQ